MDCMIGCMNCWLGDKMSTALYAGDKIAVNNNSSCGGNGFL